MIRVVFADQGQDLVLDHGTPSDVDVADGWIKIAVSPRDHGIVAGDPAFVLIPGHRICSVLIHDEVAG